MNMREDFSVELCYRQALPDEMKVQLMDDHNMQLPLNSQ
jgi:hypothetical protein